MKKLLTLIALLACFMGAKAEWVEDYSIDYSTNTGFPFYVMGYVPEWVDGVMTDYGAMFSYKTDSEMEEYEFKDGESEVGTVLTQAGVTYHKIQLASASWHQYFIADGVPTEVGGSYTVKALVRASETVTINVNMGWGWGDGQSMGASVTIPGGSEFQEVEWSYSEIGGASCNLVAQPGGSTATIEWKSLTVGHNQKAQRPTVWQEWLNSDGQPFVMDGTSTNTKYMGDAEFGAWPSWSLEETDGININWRGDRTGEICAWSLTMGRNAGDTGEDGTADGRARPYPADIELEPGTSNHVFAVHADQIAKIDDDASIQWSNQFWIQSPQGWKEGSQIRIKFRYKAEIPAKAATQIHKQHPSDYLHWQGVGDVNFTTEWQQFDKTITFDGSQATGWSLAFNLCAESTVDSPQDPNIFYFDDLSWETMVLDEGYFVAGCNTIEGLDYDFDNAIEFEEGEDWDEAPCLVATVGTKDAYVNQIMVSTVRGNDSQFKSNTLKIDGAVTMNDLLDWSYTYSESSMAKISLPAQGIWKVYLDPDYTSMAFELIEGTEVVYDDIVTNTSEIVVNGQEREPTATEQPADEEAGTPAGTGQAWDNQFWIVANRELEAGEETVLKFKYKASKAAKVSTQCHAAPGSYIHWGAIGDVNFTEEWQDFSVDFTIPNECAGKGMKSIAFNMAEIKEACDYELKDFQWYIKNEAANAEGKTPENLINATGTTNFVKKEGATSSPVTVGIETVLDNSGRKGNGAIYNIAGQRVTKDYKGIVIKDGKKYISR